MKPESHVLKTRRVTIFLRLIGIVFFLISAASFTQGLQHLSVGESQGRAKLTNKVDMDFIVIPSGGTLFKALGFGKGQKPVTVGYHSNSNVVLHYCLAGAAYLLVAIFFSVVRPPRPNLEGYAMLETQKRFRWWTGDRI